MSIAILLFGDRYLTPVEGVKILRLKIPDGPRGLEEPCGITVYFE